MICALLKALDPNHETRQSLSEHLRHQWMAGFCRNKACRGQDVKQNEKFHKAGEKEATEDLAVRAQNTSSGRAVQKEEVCVATDR